MPPSKKQIRARHGNHNHAETAAVRGLDQLADYEEFCTEILPYLRQAVKNNTPAEEIYSKAQSMAAARAVTIIATEKDTGKALAAIKDVLDRTKGKATEKKEVEHKFARMEEREVDALLLTELAELESLESGDEPSDEE